MTPKARAKFTADLGQLRKELAEIDVRGEQLTALHEQLKANRQAIVGAIQYIERQLA